MELFESNFFVWLSCYLLSLPFVGSNLGVEIFLKKGERQKKMHWNGGLRHLCVLCIGISLICLTTAQIQRKDIH